MSDACAAALQSGQRSAEVVIVLVEQTSGMEGRQLVRPGALHARLLY